VHLRIEKPAIQPGRVQLVFDDHLIAVAPDGTEVDLSGCVTEWREISKVGEARKIEVVLLGVQVMEQDGSLIYENQKEAIPA
jgi:hypothetical protein